MSDSCPTFTTLFLVGGHIEATELQHGAVLSGKYEESGGGDNSEEKLELFRVQ